MGNATNEVEKASDICPCGCGAYRFNCTKTPDEKALAYRTKYGLDGAFDKQSEARYYDCDTYRQLIAARSKTTVQELYGPVDEANILLEANEITGNGGERNDSYDHPIHNFSKIADSWSVLLRDKLKDGATISPRNVVHLMVAMKLVRDTHKPKRDNILDIAGYARCAERLSEIL